MHFAHSWIKDEGLLAKKHPGRAPAGSRTAESLTGLASFLPREAAALLLLSIDVRAQQDESPVLATDAIGLAVRTDVETLRARHAAHPTAEIA